MILEKEALQYSNTKIFFKKLIFYYISEENRKSMHFVLKVWTDLLLTQLSHNS